MTTPPETTNDKMADKTAGKMADKTAGKMADKTAGKMADKTAGKMADKVADTTPPLASLMGFGGLIPFFICAGAAHSGVTPWAGIALIISGVYGAVILSFVGAVHWGLAMRGDRSQSWFLWSVVPALYAWPPVVFLDTRTALLALVPGFLMCWSVDRRATERGLLPAWYMRLRHMLTLGAAMALAAASLAPPPFPHG